MGEGKTRVPSLSGELWLYPREESPGGSAFCPESLKRQVSFF